MNIHIATNRDAEQIQKLVSDLSHFYLSEENTKLPDWLTTSLDLAAFEERINSNDYINLLCEINNSIVGYISVKNKSHIYHLFVSQQHQRKGIAKALWENIIKICDSSKYSVRSSLYAIPVYASFGFTPSSPINVKEGIQYQEMDLFINNLFAN